MRSLQHSLALLTGFAAAGCSESTLASAPLPPDGALLVELRTDRLAYDLQGSANISMTNNTSEMITFGCEDVLERKVGSSWVEVPPLNYPCPAILIGIDPGSTLTLPFDLRPADHPGTYRLRRTFRPITASHTEKSYRRSNVFQLTR